MEKARISWLSLRNEGNDAVFVNDLVLPAGYCLGQVDTSYLHSAGLLSPPQPEHLLTTTIGRSAASIDPPPYSVAYRPRASIWRLPPGV
jgi:hypothetical protein